MAVGSTMSECTTMESKQSMIKTRKRREVKMERTLTIASLCAAIFLIVLVTRAVESSASPSSRDDPPFSYWRKGYSGHGTDHENVGAIHFTPVEYTKFKPLSNYSQRENVSHMWVDVVFKISRTFFDKMFPLDPTIPRGYIADVGKDNMRLGPKVVQDDWALWLNAFWLMWLWVLLLVAVIVLAPFAGVIYFCFCCHRCKLGCPACQTGVTRRRICLSFCMLLILPFIAGSMGLAFLSNGMLERGLVNTKIAVEMGSVDTCNFLKDVSDHIHHLFVKNYEEMETHLITTIVEAPKHLFKDLNEVADGNAVARIRWIFRNLPNAANQLEMTRYLQTSIKWVSNKLRNALRGVKRDINDAAIVLCGSTDCLKFLHTNEVEFMDASRCLHLDELPLPPKMQKQLNDLETSLVKPVWELPIARLRNISRKIKDEMARVSPPIIRDIRKGRKLFAKEGRRIEEIIDVVISDIHLSTMRASRAFEDLYDKFNETRQYVVQYIAVSLLGILSIVILALIVGCLAPRPTGASNEYFTKRIAAYMMILAMILIFCALSVMLIVVLFYFVIGGVAYKGACAPLREMKSSALLKQLDSEIDLRTMFSSRKQDLPANKSSKPVRVSSVIKACQGEMYLFTYLRENRIFDIEDFLRVKLLSKAVKSKEKSLDLSKEFILTPFERDVILKKMDDVEMGLYHSDLWFDIICENLNSLNVDQLMENLQSLSQSLSWNNYRAASVAFENAYLSLKAIKSAYHYGLDRDYRLMTKCLKYIDYVILYENYNFGDTLKILREKVVAAEDFIRDKGTTYLSTLGENLTAVVEEQIKEYIRMIIREAASSIGYCKPLTYIYDRGLELVCNRMVDPINGYWIGVLTAAFLLMPVLCIAHRLQCLYKQHKVPPIRAIRARQVQQPEEEQDPCPFCSANPNRISGGLSACIGLDGAETTIYDGDNMIAEIGNINDGDKKNKLD